MMKRKLLGLAAALGLAAGASMSVSPAQAGPDKGPRTLPGGYRHLVVIYEENHSFDNLYGSWGSVNGQHVTGLADATDANTTQVDQDGAPYDCLLQDDVNLTSPPLDAICHDSHHVNEYKVNSNGAPFTVTPESDGFDSHFPNRPVLPC